jgi:hypothetical protein
VEKKPEKENDEMALQFHWGGQVSADIQAQNQMLFDAMTPEQQQKVLKAQAERATAEVAQRLADDDLARNWLRKAGIKCAWGISILFVLGKLAESPPVFGFVLLFVAAAGAIYWVLEKYANP